MTLGAELFLFVVFLVLSLKDRNIVLLFIAGILSIYIGLLVMATLPALIGIMIVAVGVYQLSLGVFKALADTEGSKGFSQFKGLYDKVKDSIDG